MKLEELQHIFRFQTTETKDYVPTGVLSYIIFEEHKSPLVVSKNENEWELILEQVGGLTFEGYRDKIPMFQKPFSL